MPLEATRRSIPGAGILAAAAAVACLACDAAEPSNDARSPTTAGSDAAAATPPTASRAATSHVATTGKRDTLVAQRGSRIALLRDFAQRGGFELDIRTLDPTPVDANLVDRPVAEIASALAGSQPFAFEYAVSPSSGSHALVRLRIGNGDGGAAPGPRGSGEPSGSAASGSAGGQLTAFDPRKSEPEWVQRRNEIQGELETASVAERIELVEELDVAGADLEALTDVLLNDPEPAVRAAAAESLGGASTFGAVEALLRGLDDPDPQVLVAVLEGISFAGDDSLVARLGAFTSHNNPDIRNAAEEAIESLE